MKKKNVVVNQTIWSITIIKDLGIYITKDLKQNHHIKYIYEFALNTSYQMENILYSTTVYPLQNYKLYIFGLDWSLTPQIGHLTSKNDINKI